MEELAAVAEVLLEAVLVAEAAVSMTGPQEKAMPSTLAPPRRPTGAGAVAAARMGVEVAVVVALARDRRAVLPGGSTIARTAPGVGEGLFERLSGCRSSCAGFMNPGNELSDPPELPLRDICLCVHSNEMEKRGGAGRGNWGAEGEEVKEYVSHPCSACDTAFY